MACCIMHMACLGSFHLVQVLNLIMRQTYTLDGEEGPRRSHSEQLEQIAAVASMYAAASKAANLVKNGLI